MTQNQTQNGRFRSLVKVINQKELIECLMNNQIMQTKTLCNDEKQLLKTNPELNNIILIINQATQDKGCKHDNTNKICIDQIKKEIEQSYQMKEDQQKQQQTLQEISNTIKQYVEIAKQQFEALNKKIDQGLEKQNQEKDLNISLEVQKNQSSQEPEQILNTVNNLNQTVNELSQKQTNKEPLVQDINHQNSLQKQDQISGKQALLIMPVDPEKINLQQKKPEDDISENEMDSDEKQNLINKKMENTFNKNRKLTKSKNKKKARNLMNDLEFKKRQKQFKNQNKMLQHYQNILKDLDDEDEQLSSNQNQKQIFQRAVKIQNYIDKISNLKGQIHERKLRLKKRIKKKKQKNNGRKLNKEEYQEQKMKHLIFNRLEVIFNDNSKDYATNLQFNTKPEQYYLFNLFQQFQLGNKNISFVSEEQKEFYIRSQQQVMADQNRFSHEQDYPHNMINATLKLKENNDKRQTLIFDKIELVKQVSDEDKELTQKALKYFFQEMASKELQNENDEEDINISQSPIDKNKQTFKKLDMNVLTDSSIIVEEKGSFLNCFMMFYSFIILVQIIL